MKPRRSGAPRQVRIIGGQWKRTPLPVLDAEGLRPTPDRVRETVFNWIEHLRDHAWDTVRCLDLFAGSGALGFEALSRGAAHCTFVETDRAAVEALKRNIEHFGARDRAEIRQQSALTAGIGPYDLVMMDPPYGSGLGQQALSGLAERGALAPGAWISVETATSTEVEMDGFEVAAERRHGKAKLTLLTPRV
jgi:16S rRNA (guanine966-N2)-methyltransferase